MGSKALGSSLKVPIVQELAKENLSCVPPRYVRYPDPDPDHLTTSDLSPFTQIPIIDMHNLLHAESTDSEIHRLHKACKDWGFFQLINHGVEAVTTDKMRLEMEKFFNLPMEEKEEFRQLAGDIEGYGQAFVVSEEQKLDWADLFFAVTLPTNLRKPHLIPKLAAPFRHAIDAYAAQLKALAMKILSFIAKALDMNPEELRSLFEEGMQTMRMNYYPPCPQPELVTGLCPHSDAVGITILMQVNEMEGLQVKKDGRWVPVSPLPGAFIINIGDILEIVTNGAYRSIEHRAIVNAEKERLSVAVFLNPNMEGYIGPAPSLVDDKTPAKFETICTVDYFSGYFSKELEGKSYVDLMRIEN